MPTKQKQPTACEYVMDNGEPCGRRFHKTSGSVDQQFRCLMHSFDPDKNWEQFCREQRAILDQTDGPYDFSGFVFTQDTNFAYAEFRVGDAYFYDATFCGNASFEGASFCGDAYFVRAKFRQALSLEETLFGGVADFRETRFDQPARVLFRGINAPEGRGGLRLRLTNCLVDGVRFEDVRWYKRKHRLVLQDECDVNDIRDPTHELVADAYRRMVNNFERVRQYQLAEECIIGEMEMRRCNPRHFILAGRLVSERFYERHRWARWLGQNISVLNLYRLLSSYGSSYFRAFGCLAGFALLFFPCLFGLFGLRRTDLPLTTSPTISWQASLNEEGRPYDELWQTYKTALLATLETATLQRNPYVIPATGAGRGVAVGVVLVMPGQLALLLFALRRRFRR